MNLFGDEPLPVGRHDRSPVRPARPVPPPPPSKEREARHPSTPGHAAHVLTLFTEWFAEMGLPDPQRQALAFMRAHASAVVVMPEAPVIERLALERQIVRALTVNGAEVRTVARLARVHDKSTRFINKTFRRGTGQSATARRQQERRPPPCRSPRLGRFALVARV